MNSGVRTVVVFSGLLALLTACGTLTVGVESPIAPTGSGVPVPTVAASAQAPPAVPGQTGVPGLTCEPQGPTPGPASTATPVPTPTRQFPTALPELVAQPIRFATGATSATVSATLSSGERRRYVLRALAGQALVVDVVAPHPVRLSVWGADGAVLKHAGGGTTHWEGRLPSTQDYLLELAAIGRETTYHMLVTIPRLADPTPAIDVYHNLEYDFEVLCPVDFAVGMACPTAGIVDDPVVSFRLVGDGIYAGTHLLDACVVVGVDRSQAGRSTCTGLTDPHEEYWGQEEINGVLFSVISRDGVAAGHVYDVTGYRTLHAGACYAVTLLLHYSVPGVYTPGTVTEFDRDGVVDRLRQIVYGFRFTDD